VVAIAVTTSLLARLGEGVVDQRLTSQCFL
jgi:hypothetical protein